jgi:hypothetical protein
MLAWYEHTATFSGFGGWGVREDGYTVGVEHAHVTALLWGAGSEEHKGAPEGHTRLTS